MSKKILIGVIATVVIAAVIIAILFIKSGLKKQGTNESAQQNNEEVARADLDKSIDSTIEKLKTTCADFLKGDLSGDPDSDCPGFDKPINRSLCLYCYATKNQSPSLCGEINNDPALRAICQKATGAPIDDLKNQ